MGGPLGFKPELNDLFIFFDFVIFEDLTKIFLTKLVSMENRAKIIENLEENYIQFFRYSGKITGFYDF